MTDIAPELIENITDLFHELIDNNERLTKLVDLVRCGKASYEDAHKIATLIGGELAKAFKLRVSSDVLPDGRMYYNIAERLINDTVGDAHGIVAAICSDIQDTMNAQAGIAIKTIEPQLNQDRLDGIIERLSTEEEFDKVDWILDDPITNIMQSSVDDYVHENIEFQTRAGKPGTISRILVGGCCKWCRNLAGTYQYPDVPDDFYRRHENCRCMIVYKPAKGVYQSSWSKKEYRNLKEMQAKEAEITKNRDQMTEEQKRLYRNSRYREYYQSKKKSSGISA